MQRTIKDQLDQEVNNAKKSVKDGIISLKNELDNIEKRINYELENCITKFDKYIKKYFDGKKQIYFFSKLSRKCSSIELYGIILEDYQKKAAFNKLAKKKQ